MNVPEPKQIDDIKVVTLGGGCFWCTEAVFQQVPGVLSVVSGYSGGDVADPSYHQVCSGSTGHAEVVQITYQPNRVSFDDLLRIHLATHDPTTLNCQGADRGTQYRSIIFFVDPNEESIAREMISVIESEIGRKVVTELKHFEVFYPAEPEHQNYYRQNSHQGYCQVVIEPKLRSFQRRFQELL